MAIVKNENGEMDIEQTFESYDEQSHKFDRIENPPTKRSDLCALIFLDKIFPKKGDLISGAEHDQIWLDISSDEISQLTEDQIIYLRRCGVTYDSECDSLSMYV